MQIGTSIFLIAVGAILKFAVNADTEGFNIQTAGTILLIVGIVGLLISLLWMTLWSDRRERVAERPVVRERDVY
jgi:beta-lactamase regulating signal transducer with metallopeptidase domain